MSLFVTAIPVPVPFSNCISFLSTESTTEFQNSFFEPETSCFSNSFVKELSGNGPKRSNGLKRNPPDCAI